MKTKEQITPEPPEEAAVKAWRQAYVDHAADSTRQKSNANYSRRRRAVLTGTLAAALLAGGGVVLHNNSEQKAIDCVTDVREIPAGGDLNSLGRQVAHELNADDQSQRVANILSFNGGEGGLPIEHPSDLAPGTEVHVEVCVDNGIAIPVRKG